MDLFNTKLLDPDGLTLCVPNGKVFGDMVVNVSQAGRRRIDLTVASPDERMNTRFDLLKIVKERFEGGRA